MKIIFYSSGLCIGGVATAFDALARELEEEGHTVSLIVPYLKDIETVAVEKRRIVGYAWKRPCKFRLLKRFLNAFNILTGWYFYFMFIRSRTCDLFCQFLPSPDYQWAKYVSNPKCCWLHAMAPKPHGGMTGKMWQSEIKRELDRFQTIVAVSSAVANSWYITYKLNRRPVVIGNLIDFSRIRQLSHEKCWPFESSGRKRVVCIGRISHEKGQLRLIEALVGINNVEVVFVGDGANRTECENKVKSLGLSDFVQFVGSQSNPYRYLLSSHLTVVPSYEEGFGLVVSESIFLGIPVMATDCGGTRDSLSNGRYGMLVENSIAGIRNGFSVWLKNPQSVIPTCGFLQAQKEIKAKDLLERSKIREIFTTN